MLKATLQNVSVERETLGEYLNSNQGWGASQPMTLNEMQLQSKDPEDM